MIAPQMKTFKNANHEAIEVEFNEWAVEECKAYGMDVHSAELLFSPALQKFVFTIIYSTQPPVTRTD